MVNLPKKYNLITPLTRSFGLTTRPEVAFWPLCALATRHPYQNTPPAAKQKAAQMHGLPCSCKTRAYDAKYRRQGASRINSAGTLLFVRAKKCRLLGETDRSIVPHSNASVLNVEAFLHCYPTTCARPAKRGVGPRRVPPSAFQHHWGFHYPHPRFEISQLSRNRLKHSQTFT